MILHLAEDEKFIDHVIDVFEKASPNNNVYFIELPEGQKSFTYVKSQHPNIIAATVVSDEYKKIVDSLSEYQAVILHNFSPYKQHIVRNAANTIHFHWMCWGADLYCIPELRRKIILDKEIKTKITFNKKIGSIIQKLLPKFWYMLYLKPRKLPFPEKNKNKELIAAKDLEYKKLFNKITSASTVVPSEMKLIWKYLNPNIKYYPLKYICIEELTGQSDAIISHDNFLIGNSAHASSNHINAFEKIYKIDDLQKVIVPLSYGDTKHKKIVLKKGLEMFNEKFYPLLHFMPVKDYTEILLTCGNVVMNHNRQQAIGNIVISLWQGARVFLNKENHAFKYFKSVGLKVYKVSEISNYQNLMTHEELAAHNRPILKKIYAREQVVKETKELVRYLLNK